MPRHTTTILIALALLLAAPAAQAANPILGIADQKQSTFTSARFKALHVKRSRYVVPWNVALVKSERARLELRATGETLRRREPHAAEELTPQELQIALQVAQGKSNKEAGAALFLSHKTIEFHLSRIYRKLDIHSRGELIRLYATEVAMAPAT